MMLKNEKGFGFTEPELPYCIKGAYLASLPT